MTFTIYYSIINGLHGKTFWSTVVDNIYLLLHLEYFKPHGQDIRLSLIISCPL